MKESSSEPTNDKGWFEGLGLDANADANPGDTRRYWTDSPFFSKGREWAYLGHFSDVAAPCEPYNSKLVMSRSAVRVRSSALSNHLKKRITRNRSDSGDRSRRIVAQEEVAGSSPVGHPPTQVGTRTVLARSAKAAKRLQAFG
jgi:hypothetical protein